MPRFDEAGRKALVELLHRPPIEFGIERSFWTLEDLAAIAVQEKIVPAAGRTTVREAIRKAGLRWQRAKRWSTSPDPSYSEKKGSLSVW